jgi:F0F1-type ATP synthase membrane subunit b/b'
MIKFDKLEEIYKDKKRNAILLMINIFVFALDLAMFIINIVRENICGIAVTGVFVGMLAFIIIWLVITQVAINKAYKEEQAKIELETFLESQKILMSAMSAVEQLDKELKEKRKLAKEKAEQEKAKAEAEKPKEKKKAEPKAKAETKTTKKKN